MTFKYVLKLAKCQRKIVIFKRKAIWIKRES